MIEKSYGFCNTITFLFNLQFPPFLQMQGRVATTYNISNAKATIANNTLSAVSQQQSGNDPIIAAPEPDRYSRYWIRQRRQCHNNRTSTTDVVRAVGAVRDI
jgi:hypothetical protein